MPTWDPQQYERFSDLRTRPQADLMARVRSADPSLVIDLGCGNGPTTLMLAERWPRAKVVGLDSSASMLQRARVVDEIGRVQWELGSIEEWSADRFGPPDVIVSNAALQWVPTHRELLPQWLDALRPYQNI